MIRAGQVGRRATWNLGEFAELWDVPDDTEWDDKGRTMISYIRSIQFGYYGNEAPVLSEKYGSSDDHYTNLSNEFVAVKLGKDEYVTGLRGELGLCEGIRNRGKAKRRHKN
ncbi:hypothetical protein F2Q69_00010601 [Brassica cretica]|uniref:Uncharacterized protein n=1 Tax=Brassica cretica TaxID=69181 RepID=A0A8S9QEZ3_BRACR|nr:hypothetical protein F2Q69_00010601 [Brassica cretica]